MEWASGERVDKFLESRLLKPLGIQDIEWYQSPSGEIQTGGGAEMAAVSFYKIGELIRAKGKFRGNQVISNDRLKEMMTPWQIPRSGQNYGYQMWRSDFICGEKAYSGWYMAGHGGNKVVVIEDLDAVIVATSTLYGSRGMHQQTTDIINQYVLPEIGACGSEPSN